MAEFAESAAASRRHGEARSGDHPTVADVRAAAERIAGIAVKTPLVPSSIPGLHMKLENRQVTGSFKVRGAASRILALPEATRRLGLVTVSSGNHGKAVAHVAGRLGLRAVICLTSRVPPAKLAAIEQEGGEVLIAGATQEEADEVARRLGVEEGLTFVHPFDDFHVIAGQGTVGLEIAAAMPDVRRILVPLSGGGLAGGIGIAIRGTMQDVDIIGVSQEAGPAMHTSLQAGRPTDIEETDTLADALAGGLGPVNHHSFELCRRHLDGTVLVSEPEIAPAMVHLLDTEGQLVEGGGAVGAAAVLAGKVDIDTPTVVVVSGGNIDRAAVSRLRTGD